MKDTEFKKKTRASRIQEVTGTKFNQETVYSEQTSACFCRCKFNLFTPIDVTVKHKHNIATLVDFQLVAQNSYLFIYKTHLLKSSTCFEHYPVRLQEVYVVIVYMQPLVSSLTVVDCPVHRLKKRALS